MSCCQKVWVPKYLVVIMSVSKRGGVQCPGAKMLGAKMSENEGWGFPCLFCSIQVTRVRITI